ncbi:neuroglian-like [Varroa jacobsoni]|uniref:Neuroglian n=1 Tax=Varroa destructor TaxID=109461 RepID=A0A7M7M4T3_VARDE|nr:neuroglian-like [Varroa destructor]XP_022687693.1 neuroglian-like [Varroa jacobsoni]
MSPTITISNVLTVGIAPLLLLLTTVERIEVQAQVPHPPMMIKQPDHEQLFQVAQSQDETDKPFVLECEAEGTPEPEYEWIKNGRVFDYVSYDKRISKQPKRGTLIFTKPDDVDEGLYQCKATNQYGTSVSNAVFLRKSELSNFADDKTQEIFVMEGEPLSLDCKPPQGYPAPSVFWLIQSGNGALRSFNSSRITADPEGKLHFSQVLRSDSLDDAVYTCSATSHFRREYKIGNKVVLKVEPKSSSGKTEVPPVLQYTSGPQQDPLRGKRHELHCIFGGTPLPQVRWTKKGTSSLDNSNRVEITNYGKTLVIKNPDFEDEGVYECTASNGVGPPKSHSMNVKIKAAPYWVKAPEKKDAAEEETISFECNATGVPEPKLQWFINGMPIEKAPPNPRMKLQGNFLTIEQLQKKDTAVFQCNASNPLGYAFKDFYLNVLALPPNIIEAPEQVTQAVVSSTAILKCRVFGAPKPTVKWIKTNSNSPVGGRELTGGRYKVLDSGDLQITEVLVTDNGEYICKANNKFGETSASGTLDVKAKTIITQPPENYEVAADKSAVFRCNAQADNTLDLKINWLFNDELIDFERDPRMIQASDNSLTITRTIELDSGVYTCVAKTELDKDTAAATLTVQDVPNSPSIVKVSCEQYTALVEWKPNGDRRAPILSYTIQYNTSFSPDTWEDAFANIPAPDTRFKVSMSPWANYTFRVIARNKIGPSAPSETSMKCTTSESIPHKNPDKVVGRGTQKDNLVISWTPMPRIEHNAPGFFYRVKYKRKDIENTAEETSWITEDIHDWRQGNIVKYGMPVFKPYRIKVEAHNRKGAAHTHAVEVIGYSGEDKPSEVPQEFRLIRVEDAKSAEFRWRPVSPDSVNGHFKGYKIQTWTNEEGKDKMRELVVPSNQTYALARIFKPNTKNYVQVRVFNEQHESDESETISFETPEGVPGPVASFDGFPMGSSGIYLMWRKPLEPNGRLTGYHISYEEVRGTTLGAAVERSPINDPLETRAKLANLRPNTKYRITIKAATQKGKGEPYFIEVSTADDNFAAKPDVPDFIWSLQPEKDGLASVRVTWLPNTNRPGSAFQVHYRLKGSSDPWEQTQKNFEDDTQIVKGLHPGRYYEMRVVSLDGDYKTYSKIEEVITSDVAIHPGSQDDVANASWFIGMMCAIALLLLLLMIVCLVKRNRGGKYSVHEKELTRGRDLDGFPEEGGFNEYSKPVGPCRAGSRTSLQSSRGGGSESDSLAEYGDGEAGEFGEDGSFIGQYGVKKGRKFTKAQLPPAHDPNAPSALATFV